MAVRSLPRSTVYISPYVRYRCSRRGCRKPGYFGNATGDRWCVDCHARYRLVEHMSDVIYRHATGASVARSPLGDWLTFARVAEDEEIAQACAAMEVA